ncbi:hypothetical protein LTR53_000691 [Teratosphaeriaceae sp. CCFEE 6253]|nr:hypothetical protein LTR53_000691 [Teratosphaeriaceae sp. CCFEE 6253]
MQIPGADLWGWHTSGSDMEQSAATAARERAISIASSAAAAAGGHRRAGSIQTSTKPVKSAILSLFLTNLRLLDLDLLPDWPSITPASLSNQDTRARLRGTEYALYQLFRLYDPATTADKLQPFFPPLEPLQSINLRTALYRCLNDLKKNGVIGKETILRKTMLDECQGDKFWELCLGFSAVVLRKVTLERKHTFARHRHGPPIAERLGTARMVGRSQEETLVPLVIAHKAALGKLLREKGEMRERFGRMQDVLAEKEVELKERRAAVQETARSKPSEAQLGKLEAVEANVSRSWVGSKKLQQALIGGRTEAVDSVLTGPLDATVQASSEPSNDSDLLQALERTARRQSQRVRRWQSMYDQLLPSKQASTKPTPLATQAGSAHLRFDKHSTLNPRDAPEQPPRQRSETHALPSNKYDDLLTAMREELRHARRATAPPSSASPAKHAVLPIRKQQHAPPPPAQRLSVHLDTKAGAPDLYPQARSPSQRMRPGITRRASSRSGSGSSRSYHAPKVEGQRVPIPLKSGDLFSPLKVSRQAPSSPLSTSPVRASSGEELLLPGAGLSAGVAVGSRRVSGGSEAGSAVDSGVSMETDAASLEVGRKDSAGSEGTSGASGADVPNAPDTAPEREFKKPTLPSSDARGAARPSLAERTCMSMAFHSAEDVHGVLPQPMVATPEEEEEAPFETAIPHAGPTHETSERRLTLAERTRQSISLAPAAPSSKPKASHTRTRSSLFPVNQFDTPKKHFHTAEEQQEGEEDATPKGRRDITPREQLFSPEAEYDSVFRPRPKIKTSPVGSPRVGKMGSPLVGRG